MRGLLTYTACLFVIHMSCAQLTISPSQKSKANYLFVKGGYLYVENNLHLVRNNDPEYEASIYLREEAQFVQGPMQNKSNSGDGILSVFQEGTSNAYDYNYWSSPVSSAQNGLFGISMLYSPQTLTRSQAAQNSSALNGTAVPLNISSRWIYTYPGNGYFNWNYIGAATAIPPGNGFSMKGTDGLDPNVVEGRANNPGGAQRYDFRGRPNSGEINVLVAVDEHVLVGNPYPSALDLSLFLLENSGSGELKPSCYGSIQRNNVITGIAYFWDSKENGSSHYLEDYEGGYGAFSPVDPCTTGVYEKPLFKTYGRVDKSSGMSGNNIERRFTPIAQGFMVQGADGGVITFNNGQRGFEKEGRHSQFKKAERKDAENSFKKDPEVIPKLRLKVNINDTYTRSLTLAFWPQATVETDPGMDAAGYAQAASDVGWLQNGENFTIDVRPFDITDEIPLFLKVDQQESKFVFYVEDIENIEIGKIFILDTQTRNFNSIKEAPFEIDLPPGNYNGRFRLIFAEKLNETVTPGELTFLKEDQKFSVFQNNYMKELEIISDSYAPVNTVGIFDLEGKKLFFRSNFSNKRSVSISTANWANGIYIVKITDTEKQLSTVKIAIFNSN